MAQFFGSTDRATYQVKVPSSGPVLAQFIYTDIESVRAAGGSSATIGYQGGGIANDVMYSFNAHHSVRNGKVLSLVNRLAATTYTAASIRDVTVRRARCRPRTQQIDCVRLQAPAIAKSVVLLAE